MYFSLIPNLVACLHDPPNVLKPVPHSPALWLGRLVSVGFISTSPGTRDLTQGILWECTEQRGRGCQDRVHVAAVAQLVRGERERGSNRFDSRLLALHAFTQAPHSAVCSFASSTVLASYSLLKLNVQRNYIIWYYKSAVNFDADSLVSNSCAVCIL